MEIITLEEALNTFETRKGSNTVVIVNAYELDTVYCIDEFDFEIAEERHGRILRLFEGNGKRECCECHGVHVCLKSIDKICTTGEMIYIYLENQLVKIKM